MSKFPRKISDRRDHNVIKMAPKAYRRETLTTLMVNGIPYDGICGVETSPLLQNVLAKNIGKFYAYDFLATQLELYLLTL